MNKDKCSNNFDNAIKKINEANKNIKYCYIQGPTGPKGEKGDAGLRGEKGASTIKVGITETVDFENASVTNVGSEDDLILNFKIPRGKEGPIGPTGERGPAGPEGPAGAQGLKGERGEQGPSTIKIGNVTTGDPGTEAEITNTGDEKDLVLNFKIPRGNIGPKGEQGETGPRGLPGEIGITEHITIDETKTLEAGEEASVVDDFYSYQHHLTFNIPKGEKGDVGPQGPAGMAGTIAYGLRYINKAQEITVPANNDLILPLEETGTAFNTAYDTSNGIDIKENGVYKISYFFGCAPKTNCVLVLSPKYNGLSIPGGNVSLELTANYIGNISNSVFMSLSNGDVVTLNVTSITGATLSLNGSTNGVLSVVKIH